MNYPHPYSDDMTARLINWQQNDWNLQRALDARQGLVVEVAGPTDTGYVWLNSITLPSALIVTNIRPQRTTYVPDPQRDSIVHPDPVDVRAMPWADESVGVLLCSYLNIVDSDKYSDVLFNDGTLSSEERGEWAYQTELMRLLHAEVALGLVSLEDANPDALRLSFIREAERVLEPGGIVMLNGVSSQEISIMQQRGFTLRMVTTDFGPNESGEFPINKHPIYEVVLSRN